ncbi:spore coat protein [Halalkalibacterium halodurans]|jgi:spore coat protein CotF|uniref:BH3490 protein n=2 Tax=Halalkalibacterium halodurans TaxID=86665 RepID=Q9K780_HALH5|nr:spore coat protein [Halalkalibacterium halodurans]MDY7224016.1 spore coat protein [Halalkalibacterium halodurans]MDY7243301.1 spore coat protein [Halalkalibacterium halodurans]MED3646653.1 spore coat protein [Halalkalibacterium halodurans]MED4080168.1 spore coat protein [Halalkalibacterium halodurans]MED4083391.1 spore coat protein [Halalkalibacterium halodurans]
MNQQQKIQNPETPVQKNTQMSDRDFINDQLATEKYITSSYSIAMNEASHQQLYQDIFTACQEAQDCQRQLYELMFKKGWYSLEAAPEQKLQEAYQQFSGYMNQLPYH